MAGLNAANRPLPAGWRWVKLWEVRAASHRSFVRRPVRHGRTLDALGLGHLLRGYRGPAQVGPAQVGRNTLAGLR